MLKDTFDERMRGAIETANNTTGSEYLITILNFINECIQKNGNESIFLSAEEHKEDTYKIIDFITKHLKEKYNIDYVFKG